MQCRHQFNQACCKQHCALRPPPAPDQTAAAPAKAPRVQPTLTVALLLSGLVDSSHGGGLSQSAVGLWKQHVIEPLTRDRHSVHSFVCVEPQKQWNLDKRTLTKLSGWGVQPQWGKLRTTRSPLILLDSNRSRLVAQAHEQYSRLEACYLEARRYERTLASSFSSTDLVRKPAAKPAAALLQARRLSAGRGALATTAATTSAARRLGAGRSPASSGASAGAGADAAGAGGKALGGGGGAHAGHGRRKFAFSHFVRARPDLLFYAAIPLSAFERYVVSIRARALMFADECETIHRSAIAKPGDGQKRTACDVSKVWGPKQGGATPTSARNAMHEAGISTCASVDDMFAIAPAHLADAAFLTPQLLAERPMGSAQYGHRGWDANHSVQSIAAVRRTYGSQMSPLVYVGVCGGGSRINFMNAHEVGDHVTASWWARHHGLPAVASAKPGAGCCETRMSARLISRLVPMRYTKLPFNCQFGSGGGNHPEANCSELYGANPPTHRSAGVSRGTNTYKSCMVSNPGLFYC